MNSNILAAFFHSLEPDEHLSKQELTEAVSCNLGMDCRCSNFGIFLYAPPGWSMGFETSSNFQVYEHGKQGIEMHFANARLRCEMLSKWCAKMKAKSYCQFMAFARIKTMRSKNCTFTLTRTAHKQMELAHILSPFEWLFSLNSFPHVFMSFHGWNRDRTHTHTHSHSQRKKMVFLFRKICVSGIIFLLPFEWWHKVE